MEETKARVQKKKKGLQIQYAKVFAFMCVCTVGDKIRYKRPSVQIRQGILVRVQLVELDVQGKVLRLRKLQLAEKKNHFLGHKNCEFLSYQFKAKSRETMCK